MKRSNYIILVSGVKQLHYKSRENNFVMNGVHIKTYYKIINKLTYYKINGFSYNLSQMTKLVF